MVTEVEKIERIDRSEKEIKDELSNFFKKYNLVLKKKSERGFIFANDTYKLNFVYGQERYYWFIFQDLIIEIENKIYNFRNIINFMQREKQQNLIDTYDVLRPFSTYEKYLESHLIPFLEMEKNIEKIEKYIKKKNFIHRSKTKPEKSKIQVIKEKMERLKGFNTGLTIPTAKEINILKNRDYPKEYLEFIEKFGNGVILEDMLHLWKTPKEIEGFEKSGYLGHRIVFGDNFSGKLFLFDTRSEWKVIVITEQGDVLDEFLSFFDFIIDFLDDIVSILDV